MARRSKKQSSDDDGMPDFLRRSATPELLARADRVVAEVISGKREWIMPKGNKARKEDNVQIAFECEDEDLPVEVRLTSASGKVSQEKFDNARKFMDWFDPAQYVLEGTIADAESTMASVREKEPPRADPKTIKAAEAKIKKGEVEVVHEQGAIPRGAVIKKGRGTAPQPAASSGKGKPRGHGFVKHKCKVTVGGKTTEHGSVYKAFCEHGLPVDLHVKFRSGLKASSTLTGTFEHKGKKYDFRLEEVN